MQDATPGSPLTEPPASFTETDARRALQRGVLSVLLFTGVLVLVGAAVANSELGAVHVADIRARVAPGALVLSTVAMSLAFVIMGLRWRALLPPQHRPPTGGLTAIILAGLLLNYALPGPMGELGAGWFAHKRYRVPLADALATGVTARIIGLATAALLAAVVWAITDVPAVAGTERMIAAASGLIGLGGLALAGLAVRPSAWQRLTRWLAGPLLRRGGRTASLAERGVAAVDSLALAIAGVVRRGRGPLLAAALWSTVGHLTVTFGIAVAIWGLQSDFDPAGLAFTYAATTAGAVALFALPGSQIGWDAMFITLLVWTTGLAEPDAVAIGVLVRLQQLGYMLVGAVMVAWLLHSSRLADRGGQPGGAPAPDPHQQPSLANTTPATANETASQAVTDR
jgi:hypothetical protein